MEQPKTPNGRDYPEAAQEESQQTDRPAPSGKTHKSPNRRRSRKPGGTTPQWQAAATRTTSSPAESLKNAIEEERIQLMQVHALLKCLYEVLLYADGEDSLMHADVTNVAARLIDDSANRLERVLDRSKAGGS